MKSQEDILEELIKKTGFSSKEFEIILEKVKKNEFF